MKRFLALVRINLITASEDLIQNMNISSKKQTPFRKWGTRLLIVGLIVYLLGIVSFISSMIVSEFIRLNQTGLLIYLIFTVAPIVTLYFSILSTPSVFYFSRDIPSYLSLPIFPREIIGAKFVVSYIQSCISSIGILGPLLLILIIRTDAGILFGIYTLLGLLIMPLIPLSLAVVIVVLLMRFVPFLKNKDLFMYLSFGLIFIPIFIVSFSTGMVSADEVAIQGFVESLVSMDNNAFRSLSFFFPTSKWITTGIVDLNILPLLFTLALSLGVGVIAITVSQPYYFEGVLSVSEVGTKKKKLNLREKERETKGRTLTQTILLQDIKTILRTPAFALNYLSPMVLLPLMTMLPAFLSGDFSSNFLFEILGIHRGFNDFFMSLTFLEKITYPLIVGFAIGLFAGNLDASSNTAISRDANNLKAFITFPIQFSEIVKAKVYLSIILSSLIPLILIVLGIVILHPTLITILCFILGVAVGIVLVVFIGIFVDVYAPSLNWQTEQQAVKGNFKSMLVIIPFFFIPIIIVVAGFFLPLEFFLPSFLIIVLALIYLMIKITYKVANTKLVDTVQTMNH